MILNASCAADELKEPLMKELHRYFRPEFLNRVDETLIFHKLSRENIRGIVDIQLELFRRRLAAQGVALEVTDKAKEFIADSGYDPAFGARPLKRAIIRLIETPVSRLLLQGEYPENTTLVIDCDGEKLTFGK